MNIIRFNLQNLIKFKKVNSSLFNVEYDDELVYKELDKVSEILGDLSKYSASVNNILAEELLKRTITDLFLEEFGSRYTEDEKIVNIEHLSAKTNTKLFFTISFLEGKDWGAGYIYSLRDGSII